jgi:hypothetical protein
MVDRIARDRYSELIRHFCAGLMSNVEYDDRAAVIRRSTRDPGVEAVFWAIWGLYDDLRTHRLTGRWRLTRTTRREVARCLLFLQSNDEYLWPSVRWYGFFRIACMVLAAIGLYWSADLRWYGPGVIAASITVYTAVGIVGRRSLRRQGDEASWPFLHTEGLEEARRHPRLLNGR